MAGNCKVCGSYDDYAEPNINGDIFCYIHFVDFKLKCLCCETTTNVSMHCSRTSYYWDGNGEDPNADIPLCDLCAKDHNEYWDDMYAQFYYSKF